MNEYKYWFLAAAALSAGGIVNLFFDWMRYSSTLNSAPFSLWVLVNGLVFGLPAVGCCLVGRILQKRSRQRKDDTQ